MDALGRLAARTDSPMVIVTAAAPDGRRAGCLVGFWTQCSIHPPRVLACISKPNHTLPVATAARVLAVHWLADDDRRLAELFGGETGDEVDKFARCAWHDGPGGVPILDECPNWFVGRVLWRSDAGDHDAFLLEPVAGENGTDEAEFTFHRAKRIDPGHEA